MAVNTNRIIGPQFGDGITLDGSRIQAARDELIALVNSLPPDLVAARWSPTLIALGFMPSISTGAAPPPTGSLPFMGAINDFAGTAALQKPTPPIPNQERVKSCDVAAITFAGGTTGDLLTWETSVFIERPTILAAATLFAEDSDLTYNNTWLYGDQPPTGESWGAPTHDVTLQVCVDDLYQGFDRKRLKQEAVTFNYDTAQFKFNTQNCAAGLDTMKPQYRPNAVAGKPFNGKAIRLTPYILLPEYSRLRLQWTIPQYGTEKDAYKYTYTHAATGIGDRTTYNIDNGYGTNVIHLWDSVTGAETPAQIATAIAAVIAVDPASTYTASAAGAVVTLTSRTASKPGTTITSVVNTGGITGVGAVRQQTPWTLSTWGPQPWAINCWSASLQLWEAARG